MCVCVKEIWHQRPKYEATNVLARIVHVMCQLVVTVIEAQTEKKALVTPYLYVRFWQKNTTSSSVYVIVKR